MKMGIKPKNSKIAVGKGGQPNIMVIEAIDIKNIGLIGFISFF